MANKYFEIKEKHNRWEGIRKSVTGERLKVTIVPFQTWEGTDWDIELYKFYKGRYEFVRRSQYKDIDDGVEHLVEKCIERKLIKDFVKIETKMSERTLTVPIIDFGDEDCIKTNNGRVYPKEVLLKAVEEYAERTNLNMRLVGKMIEADIKADEEMLNLNIDSFGSYSISSK